MIAQRDIFLRGIAAELPDTFLQLADLQLRSKVETLEGFGFTGAAVAHDLDSLTLAAARQALSDAKLDAVQCDVLLYASALAGGHLRASERPSGGVLDQFCYRASWLQETLSLDRSTVCGISQQGCAGFFSSLRHARALLVAEPALANILLVGADAFDPSAEREILFNVVSDAACAAVLSSERGFARWLAYAQISKGYYWDVPARESELIAAYFPTARAVIAGALRNASLRPSEIDLVIPTGVNASSWPILLRLCGFVDDQLYRPAFRIGHTIAADSLLSLDEARSLGRLRPGMRILLFTYGFGSSWCALILQITEEVAE